MLAAHAPQLRNLLKIDVWNVPRRRLRDHCLGKPIGESTIIISLFMYHIAILHHKIVLVVVLSSIPIVLYCCGFVTIRMDHPCCASCIGQWAARCLLLYLACSVPGGGVGVFCKKAKSRSFVVCLLASCM